jgi:hypothetical protein
MNKTEAQVAAEQRLLEAIEEAIRVYAGDNSSLVLGDYAVLTTVQTLTEEGILITRYPIFLRDGDMPWYRILGLLEMAKLQTAEQATDTNNNG